MRLETLPLLLGILLGVLSIALIIDAWAPDEAAVTERRQRFRQARNRFGEALLGFGVLSMAAALVGRDTWRYSVVNVIVGAVLLLWGIQRNAGYLRGVFARSDQRAPANGPHRVR